MPVCRKHGHARWTVQALINCTSIQNMDIGNIKHYNTFFQYLTSNYETEDTTYIDWACNSDKKAVCPQLMEKWNNPF